jgi:RNA polymerase-binding transcription factor
MSAAARKMTMEETKIEQLKQKLERQRQEGLQVLTRLQREIRSMDVNSTQDSADQCVIAVSKEALFEQSSQRRMMLRLIEAALRRITDGSFAECVACGDDIQDRRLLALPWTQFCLRCQEELEEEISSNVAARTHTPAATAWRRAG